MFLLMREGVVLLPEVQKLFGSRKKHENFNYVTNIFVCSDLSRLGYFEETFAGEQIKLTFS